ncbi:hypothetical protein HR12_15790 [Microbacterium sp. SUBG005]|nr:hypothetical protein HR12_15790 [Microbacterium sp. SUBG005]
MIVQLSDHFVGKARHLTIVQHFRQQRVFVALLFFDLILLTRDVAFVFHLDLDLFSRFRVFKARRERGQFDQILVSDFRTTQQIFPAGFARQRCC